MEDYNIILSAVGIISGWLFNTRRQRLWDQDRNKENHYAKILTVLQECKESNSSAPLFLNAKTRNKLHYDTCWLYAPPKVIRAINDFLFKIDNGGDEIKDAYENIIISMRKDIYAKKYIFLEENIGKDEFMQENKRIS